MPFAKELVGVGIAPLTAITIPNGIPTAVVAAGSTQATGTAIGAGLCAVTGADGTKGVTLPACEPGGTSTIVNDSGSSLKVYPPVGAAIGIPGTSYTLAVANTAITQTTFSVVTYTCFSATLWMLNKSA